MFLATTASRELWKHDERLLLLGAWCVPFESAKELEGLQYEIMPCPWENRTRFHDTATYLDEFYERRLIELSAYLEEVHGVRFSIRYWRILVGPWLQHYLHSFHDRYVHLKSALEQYSDLHTVVLDPTQFRTPRGTLDTVELFNTESFNLQVFSQILALLGFRFPATSAITAGTEPPHTSRMINGLLLKSARGLNWLLRSYRQCTLTDLYLPPRLLWDLCLKSRFRLIPQEFHLNESLVKRSKTLNKPRLGLVQLDSRNDFERVFSQSLLENLPPLYLESFKEARQQVLRLAEPFPSVMASTVGWFYNEAFRFAAAEAAERGTRIVTVQHGGGYGIYQNIPSESHEREIGDQYLVNGWAKEGDTRCRNVPDPRMSSLLPRHWNSHSQTVLFVSTGQPRQLYRFHSNPVCDQWLDYVNGEIRFLNALGARRESILFRGYTYEYGLRTRERIASAFPDLKWDDRSESLYSRLNRSRIVVIDHSGTSMLETLAANLPTILFWNPNHWEVRAEARPYFDMLQAAGVFWDAPEAAANHLLNVYDNVNAWWQSHDVQKARRLFVDRFARIDPQWPAVWSDALLHEIPQSTKPAYQISAIEKH